MSKICNKDEDQTILSNLHPLSVRFMHKCLLGIWALKLTVVGLQIMVIVCT